jgi:hypothetical protein
MAAKDEELEYFYDAEKNLDRAFSDTVGRIAAMKLGFAPKKPDRAKVKALLEKHKRPTGPAKGSFFLSLNGLKLTFEVRVASSKIVLNTLDLEAVKDMAKRRNLLWQLSERTHLVTEADLAAFDKENADPEDSGPAVQLNQKIDKLKRANDNMQSMLDAPNYKKKEYSEWDSEFRAWAEAKNYDRFTAFVNDVANGRGLSDKGRALLEHPESSGIKPATLKEIQAARDKGETPDFTKARKEVVEKINKFMLPTYNQEKIANFKSQIKANNEEIAKLTKQLKTLKAD